MTEFDGERFRKGVAREDEAARRYADEHRDRIRRKQSNGSPSVVAEYEGKGLAADKMAHSARTDTVERLHELLDEMEGRDPPMSGIDDDHKDEFRRGYHGFVREVRGRHPLPPPDPEPEAK